MNINAFSKKNISKNFRVAGKLTVKAMGQPVQLTKSIKSVSPKIFPQ